MREETLIVQHSPFVFFKRVFWVQLLFTLLPGLAIVIGLRDNYSRIPFYEAPFFGVLSTILLVLFQVVLIAAVFATWYTPRYVVRRDAIRYQRGSAFGSRRIAATQQIDSLAVSYGPLGKRFGYGSVKMKLDDGSTAVIRDVEDPEKIADLIDELIDPEFTSLALAPPESIAGLLTTGENQTTEFKASLTWDYHQQRVNKQLYVPVLKNVVAFMNSEGGRLIIGVSDEGEVLGLEPDYLSFHKQNADGFENVFNSAFNQMVGAEFRRYVALTFPLVAEKEICVITVKPSAAPAYLNAKGSEQFYIRAGNASQPLSVSKAAAYIQDHFGRR